MIAELSTPWVIILMVFSISAQENRLHHSRSWHLFISSRWGPVAPGVWRDGHIPVQARGGQPGRGASPEKSTPASGALSWKPPCL